MKKMAHISPFYTFWILLAKYQYEAQPYFLLKQLPLYVVSVIRSQNILDPAYTCI